MSTGQGRLYRNGWPIPILGRRRGLIMRKTENRGPDRRHVLAGAAALGVTLGARRAKAASPAASPVVSTKYGKVRGMTDGVVHIFKGVPYGAPTSGEGRFMPPKAPAPWSDVRDAIALGPRAPQTDAADFIQEEVAASDHTAQSEDCLVLNIWTPGLGEKSKRPVMVWCH